MKHLRKSCEIIQQVESGSKRQSCISIKTTSTKVLCPENNLGTDAGAARRSLGRSLSSKKLISSDRI